MPVLHNEYADIARPYMDDFVAKKGEERIALVQTVVSKITAHSQKKGIPLPPSLNHVCAVASLLCLLVTSVSQKVENWFHNHRPHVPKPKNVKKRDKNGLVNWSVRKVVQHTKKDLILERMAENAPDVAQNDDQWISSYHLACTQVINDLSPGEKKECERIADEWNATGPDPLTQAL
jgi:hypothetical protein